MATGPDIAANDSELLNKRLRYTSHEHLPPLSPGKPDRELVPIVIGQIEFPVEIESLHCSHCRTKFWNGYLVTDSSEKMYVIGSLCGPKYYEAEHFKRTQANHKAEVSRQKLLFALRDIAAQAQPIIAWGEKLLRSGAYAALVKARTDFQKRGGDAAFRLKQAVIAGRQLTEVVQITDYTDRADRRLDGNPKKTWEEVAVGSLRGSAFVDDRVDLERSLRIFSEAAADVSGIINGQKSVCLPDAMRKAIRTADLAYERLQEDAKAIGSAHHFFDKDNLERIERWSSRYNRHFTAKPSRTGLAIRTDRGTVRVSPVKMCRVTPPPRLRQGQDGATL